MRREIDTLGAGTALYEPFGDIEDANPGGSQAIISTQAMKRACRHRWKLIAGMALAGLILGCSMHLLIPAKAAAVSRLYLTEPSGTDPAQAMTTDLSLLHTRLVAQEAITLGRIPLSADALLASYSGTAPSNSILSIKLNASSPSEAVAWNNAVAKAFLAVRTNAFTASATSQAEGLGAQLVTVQAEVAQLTKAINATPVGAARTALVDQLATAVTEATNLQTQIRQTQAQPLAIGRGSYVLDAAAPNPVSHKKVLIKDGLSGLVAGLALGLIVVVVGAIVSDRPRRRIEVAAVLGAPVTLSVGRYRGSRWLLRRQVTRPKPKLRMIERRIKAQLESTPDRALAVVAVDDFSLAAVAVAAVAYTMASDGGRVVLSDAAYRRPLARLLRAHKAQEGFQTVTVGDRTMTMTVSPDDPAEMPVRPLADDHDAVLLLASLDPAFGAEHISGWATNAVVLVTAGKSSSTRIHAVAQMLRHAGISVRAAILIGADPDDETVAAVEPDNARTVTRLRSVLQLSPR